MRQRLIDLTVTGLLLLLASWASAQSPPATTPTAPQIASELCNLNRVRGEQDSAAIIAQNSKVIHDLQGENARLKTELDALKAPKTEAPKR